MSIYSKIYNKNVFLSLFNRVEYCLGYNNITLWYNNIFLGY